MRLLLAMRKASGPLFWLVVLAIAAVAIYLTADTRLFTRMPDWYVWYP